MRIAEDPPSICSIKGKSISSSLSPDGVGIVSGTRTTQWCLSHAPSIWHAMEIPLAISHSCLSPGLYYRLMGKSYSAKDAVQMV